MIIGFRVFFWSIHSSKFVLYRVVIPVSLGNLPETVVPTQYNTNLELWMDQKKILKNYNHSSNISIFYFLKLEFHFRARSREVYSSVQPAVQAIPCTTINYSQVMFFIHIYVLPFGEYVIVEWFKVLNYVSLDMH